MKYAPKPLLALSPLALFLATSCTVLPEGHVWQPTFGIDRTVVDNYELEVDVSGFGSASTDVDYTVTQV
ncbi:MAG: hypothetical protein ACYS26_21925, partial [Planctomycetota bacterium]